MLSFRKIGSSFVPRGNVCKRFHHSIQVDLSGTAFFLAVWVSGACADNSFVSWLSAGFIVVNFHSWEILYFYLHPFADFAAPTDVEIIGASARIRTAAAITIGTG